MNEEQFEKLKQAGLLALGYIYANDRGEISPICFCLAKTLKECGAAFEDYYTEIERKWKIQEEMRIFHEELRRKKLESK